MIIVAYRPTCRQSLRKNSGAGVFEDLSDTIGNNAMEHTTIIVAMSSYTSHLSVNTTLPSVTLVTLMLWLITQDLLSQLLHWVRSCGRKESAINVCARFAGNPVCSRGTCHNHISAYPCKCPSGYVSVEESCKSQCRIVVCGKAQPPCLAAGTGLLHRKWQENCTGIPCHVSDLHFIRQARNGLFTLVHRASS